MHRIPHYDLQEEEACIDHQKGDDPGGAGHAHFDGIDGGRGGWLGSDCGGAAEEGGERGRQQVRSAGAKSPPGEAQDGGGIPMTKRTSARV